MGVPFNIASYALLTSMIAHVMNYEVGDFIITFGDAHIYLNHTEQVRIQLERKPYKLPSLELNKNHLTKNDLYNEALDAIVYMKSKLSKEQ